MDVILRYFPHLSEVQKNQFAALKDLYTVWNERINVISRKDIDNLYLHHVLHSLAIAKVMPAQEGDNILDIGTGGGFPGIPLAIFFPQAHFHLVDSIGKKIKVVEAVTQELGLANVTYEQIRAEQLKQKFDFVVSRAVTSLPDFTRWIAGKMNKAQKHKIKNGLFYLKGGNLEEETAPYKNRITMFDISDFFKESYFETKKIIYLPIS